MKDHFKNNPIQDRKIEEERNIISIIFRIKEAEENSKSISKKEKDIKAVETLKKFIKEINDIIGEYGDAIDFIDPAGRMIRDKRYSYKKEIKIFKKEIKKYPDYNPIFTYPKIDKLQEYDIVLKIKEIGKIMKRIKLEEKNEHIKKIVFEYIENLVAQMNIILSVKRGNDAGTYQHSIEAYGDINTELVAEGEKYYQNKLKNITFLKNSLRKKLKKINISSEGLKYIFQMTLDIFNIKDFNINLKKEAELISVSDYRNEIKIPYKRLYSSERAIKLVAHEICTHAISIINNRAAGFPRASIGKNITAFNEGIAMCNEKKFEKYIFCDCKPNDKDWYIHAMSYRKKRKGFGQTFLEIKKRIFEQFIAQYIEPQKAEEEAEKNSLIICRRIFRGMHDLSSNSPYYYTKDSCYFKGYMESQKMIEEGLDHYLTEIRVDPYLLPYFISIKALPDKVLYMDRKVMEVIWQKIKDFLENYNFKKDFQMNQYAINRKKSENKVKKVAR